MNDAIKIKDLFKKIIVVFFIYMILEGSIRKWIFPELYTQIYFVKDIVLIIIYIIALKYNLIFNSKFSRIVTFVVIIISLWGFIGYFFSNLVFEEKILFYIMGIRSYWLYLPLFLIITQLFNRDDLNKYIKLNLYIFLPYFLLVILQTYLPDSSILNAGYHGMIMNPERPSAFFTYTTQNTFYYLFLFGCYCSYILSKQEILMREIIFFTFINLSLIILLIFLKSRAPYFYVFAITLHCCFFLIFSDLNKKLKLKKIFLILFVTLISFQFSKVIFKDQYEYSKKRLNTDTYTKMSLFMKSKDLAQSENEYKNLISENLILKFCKKNSSLCRIIDEFYIVTALEKSSFYGEGIGAGSKMVTRYNNDLAFSLGESENKRLIMELGYLGLMVFIFKIFIVIFLNLYALLKFRKKQKLIYVPILSLVSFHLLISPLTYTTSFIQFIFWFLFGLLFLSFNEDNKSIYK